MVVLSSHNLLSSLFLQANLAAAASDKKKKASRHSSESEDEDHEEEAGESFNAEQYYKHFVSFSYKNLIRVIYIAGLTKGIELFPGL